MEVILLENIDNLGYKNEIVNVKPGFARNYLIPNKKAKVADKTNKKALEEMLRQQKLKLEKEMAEYEAQAEKIRNTEIIVGAKTGTSDKIFGSITSIQLAEAIKDQTGVVVDRKKIIIKEEVKSTGKFEGQAELHKDVKADFVFKVVSE